MQVPHAARAVSASFDDPNLVSTVGLVPITKLAEKAGLRALAQEWLSVPTDKGANAGLKAALLVGGMVAGADSIDDMDVLRHGGMRKLFTACDAPSTFGPFLRAFVSGTVVLVVIALIQGAGAGFVTVYPAEPWLYLGGVVGMTFVFGLAFAVRHTGVLLLGMGTVAGQVVAALVLDLVAPGHGNTVDWVTFAAAALAGIAVVIASSPGNRGTMPRAAALPAFEGE